MSRPGTGTAASAAPSAKGAASPDPFRGLGPFYGPNAGYVLELWDRYRDDPAAVDPATRAYFDRLDPAAVPTGGLLTATNGHPTNGHAADGHVGTAPATPAQPATASGQAVGAGDVSRVIGAVSLVTALREYGHLAVRLDPLGGDPPGAPELDTETHGVTEADLAALPASVVGGPVAEGAANAAEAVARLRAVYVGAIGYDLDHIQAPAERAWLRDAVETCRYAQPLDAAAKRALLGRLTEVEAFEVFLHQTYLGQKRFSIEGTDVLVPVLDEVIHTAASHGTREVVLGMAHRGRLNVLAHVLGRPYEAVIAAFEGGKGRRPTPPDATDDATDDATGDVKYHLGARLAQNSATGETVEVPVVLAPNPSHLEAVNPVVVGMARASQEERTEAGEPKRHPRTSLAILLHGDAAFPGQGIVAETLNLSGLRGYTVGGTVHIIVNNQIGFTTDTHDSRSTLYAGDLAKGFEIPIFHVNADDPEACLTVARLAIAYRETFAKDVLIDLVGYRRWGHNEGEEPLFTQPLMYASIPKHPTVRARWAERLAAEGVVTADEAAALRKQALDRLAEIRRAVTEGGAGHAEEVRPRTSRREVETAVPEDRLRAFHAAIHALPEGFAPTRKLARQWERRRGVLDAPDGKVDWGHAEALAFAAILADGTPIRITGQDTQQGTFSQRHAVLHDGTSGALHAPLQSLPDAKASFAIYNSPLSEEAAVGFEYGYSVHAPETLVLWEAQFGDFVNGAQVVIDQFLVSARAKWRQTPALVLLLPHGYEGQGPEHSSGRLERFLQLSAGDNLRVANCTTAGQYFHLLRRQAGLLASDARPLILMTPKSLLRHPFAASPLADLSSGTFRPVIDDPRAADRRAAVTRLVLCSGKVFVDLEASDARAQAEGVAVVRVEQLAPFQNGALRTVIEGYPNLAQIVWAQEEPRNMGAWTFMEPRLRELTGGKLPIRYVGRPERASPAEGSADRHAEEQARIVSTALTGAAVAGAGAATPNGARAGSAGPSAAPNGATANGRAEATETAPAARRGAN